MERQALQDSTPVPASYRRILAAELERRCTRNPNYSLRAFSNAIGVRAGTLSNILAQRRSLSLETAKRIVAELQMDSQTAQDFMQSVLLEKHSALAGEPGLIAPMQPDARRGNIEAERFTMISEWHHLAILSLIETRNFQSNNKWIARQLMITEIKVKLALDRLENLGLIQKQNGRWIRIKGPLFTTDRNRTAAGLRKFQSQMLEKANESLNNDPIDIRGHFGMTMAINPKKIPQAKMIMQKCLDQLAELLETGPREQVYHAGIQLFPIQSSGEAQ